MQLFIEVLGAGMILHTPAKQTAIRSPSELLTELGNLPTEGDTAKPPHGSSLDVTRIENGWRCEIDRQRLLVLEGDEPSAAKLFEVCNASGGMRVQAKKLADAPGDDADEVDIEIGPISVRTSRAEIRRGSSLFTGLMGFARAVSQPKKQADELEARRVRQARQRAAELEARRKKDEGETA